MNLAEPAVENALADLSRQGVVATNAGSAPLRLRTVDASLEDLEHAVNEAHSSTPAHEGEAFVEAGASVSATIDVVNNTVQVIVELPDKAPVELQQATADRAEAAAEAAESSEPSIDGRVEVKIQEAAEPAGCSPVYSICDPALRGGQGIVSTQLCTLGLPVRSRTNALPYILTAGHCFDGVRTRNFDYYSYEPGSWPLRRDVGNGHNYVQDITTTDIDDYGIIEASTAGHAIESRVLVEAQGGDRPTVRNEWYDIGSTGNIGALPADSYLCHTGFVTGTRCGRFTGTERGLGRYEAFVCQGDGGGPVFAQNKLYGIVQGYRFGVSEQRYVGLPDPIQVKCAPITVYQGADEALNNLNVEIF